MNTDGWRKEIARAHDPEALLRIMQRFVSALDVVDTHALPDEFRPRNVQTRQDIAFWSFALASAILSEEMESERDALGEIALVFAEAAAMTTSLAVGRKAYTPAKNLAHEGEPVR
jgi:hypothetical protein